MEQKASSGETETEREANQMFSAAASSPQDEDVSQMDSSSKKQRQESPACSATTEKQELFGVMGLDEDEIDEDVEAVLSLPDPPEIPDPEMADSLVARQMYKLSRKEREKVFCDLHGVSDATEETPEMINKAYIDLDNEIRLLMEKNRETAYETAKTMDQNFVENRKFQLAFLRADRFDSKLAALRLVRHFEAKLELFGKSNLVKEVVQDDLEKDDMEVLYDGASQILPVRDRVGRIVFLWFSTAKHNSASDKAKCRRMFYNGMFYSEEEETQKKGAIAVIYSIGHQQSQGYKRNPFFQMPKLLKALPLRIEGLHICYDSAFWLPAFAITRLSFPLFTRLRIRSHFGSHQECLLALQSFGIPAHFLPLTDEGVITTDFWHKFLERRRNQERMAHKSNIIYVPARSDVLLGRGNLGHIGNIRFRKLIEDCWDKYDNASTGEKTRMSQEIVEIVKECGGCFLKDDGDGWVEVGDDVARRKVAHAFRGQRSNKISSSQQE